LTETWLKGDGEETVGILITAMRLAITTERIGRLVMACADLHAVRNSSDIHRFKAATLQLETIVYAYVL